MQRREFIAAVSNSQAASNSGSAFLASPKVNSICGGGMAAGGAGAATGASVARSSMQPLPKTTPVNWRPFSRDLVKVVLRQRGDRISLGRGPE
jgi:hypothetical protein